MPTYASTVQNNDNVVYGSCKVEVSDDNGVNWDNVGAVRAAVFTENQTVTPIQSDNTENISDYISEHSVTITWNSLELYLPDLDKIRGDIDLLTVTGGVKTSDTRVLTTGAWSRNVPYYYTNQGNTDTLPAAVSVKSVSTANATDTLSSTKDYTTFTDASNKSGIIVLSTAVAGGDTGLTTQSLRIRYEYETIPSRKLTSGGLSTISKRMFRFTNKQIIDGVDKFRYFVVYSAAINAGLNLAFKSSNEADPVLELPMSVQASLDTSRTEGDQLFYIVDEAGVA